MENYKGQRLKKYSREAKAKLPARRITERSTEIVKIIHNYKFIPTSLVVRLIDGDMRNIERHLQNLYHLGFVNRFAFPSTYYPTEFIYYLDDKKALELLITAGADPEELDYEMIKNNREKAYSEITMNKEMIKMQGRLMHLHHEIMISRFHFLLEKACRKTDGKVQLLGFYQGSELWNTVTAPKVHFDSNGNWRELEETETLPHRPDAFFALHFPDRETEKTDYYFYEADRKTTPAKKHNRKLRSHFHYIVKQKKQEEDYGVKRIKAVLIESIDSQWADYLRRSARHPVVSGFKPSPLFYFTTSEVFEEKITVKIKGRDKEIPRYLEEPELIFKNIWATPLDDDENPNFRSLIKNTND